jgi:hypothetical protein
MSDSLSKRQIVLLGNLREWLNLPGSKGVLEDSSIPNLPTYLPAAEVRVLLHEATTGNLLRYDDGILHPKLPHIENRPFGPHWVFTQQGLDVLELKGNLVSRIEINQPIPAADRFVRIDHNSGEIKEIKEALDDLEGKTSRSNDLFATQDEKLAVLSELSNLQKLFAGEWLRVGALAHSIESRGVVTYLHHKG